MDFSDALRAIKAGKRLARAGWNGKGMLVFLVPGSVFKVNRPPLLGIYPEGTEIDYHGHVDMRTATGQIVPWLCSQTDMLADDWMIASEDLAVGDAARADSAGSPKPFDPEPRSFRQPHSGQGLSARIEAQSRSDR